jgi:putative membrane protein
MNTTLPAEKVQLMRKIIIVVSIAIPIAVAALLKIKIPGVDLSFLPPTYATINGLTAILLIAALVAIKSKKTVLHQRLIQVCLMLSLLFLLGYVAYHMTSEPTSYGGEQTLVYYFILTSHIILSVAVVPLVLYTYLFAWQGDFTRHKKWTKIAFPIWLYVAVTGVIVYWMIAPFYGA